MQELGMSRRDPARQSFRKRLVSCIAGCFRDHQHVFIQAQAGQGKTTAAIQYLDQSGVEAVWYALGTSDRDPVAFIDRFYQSCRRALSGFRAPLLEEMLEKGEITASEHAKAVDFLLQAFHGREVRSGSCCLVLDDLHFLPAEGETLALIAGLLRRAPDHLRWLVLSRQPIAPALGFAGESTAAELGNSDLAFTPGEIVDLYTGLLDIPLGRSEVRRLAEVTEGWVMGLLLLAGSVSADRGLETLPNATMDALRVGRIPDFFREQLLDRLLPSQREQLYCLALLDSIPASLAARVAPDLEPESLTRKNLFLRSMRDGSGHYAFHHLFQESLREMGERELTRERRQEVLHQAAEWHRQAGDPERALRYLLGAGDYSGANTLAREAGLELLARNRLLTLHGLLESVPKNIVGDFPWLGYLMAVSLLNSDPPQALAYLQRARARFEEQGDGEGELLTLAQLCLFHMAVDADYGRLPELVERAEPLFEQHVENLSVPMRVQCAHYIGFAILQNGTLEAAHRYSNYALRLARKHGLDNLVASLVCNQAYESAFFGDWPGFARQGDRACELLANPRVTSFNRFLLYLLQANFLAVSGDLFNYRHRRDVLLREVEDSILNGTLCQPFVWLWDIDAAVVEGRLSDAWDTSEQALSSESTAASDHMTSQYMQYRAYVAAIRGDEQLARQEADNSWERRRRAKHRFHTHVNHLLLGATFVRLGDSGPARDHLNWVIECETQYRDFSLAPAAWAQLAFLHFGEGDEDAGRRALAEALRRMREHGYEQFFTWEPGMMRELLERAVRHGIETDTARRLARRKLGLAMLDDGRTIPLLTVRTLGGLRLQAGDGREITEADLSPLQRDLLALVLGAPGLSIGFDRILTTLWPDVEPDKGRARLDTHIARLRKTLAGLMGVADINDYLSVENKHLCLCNARVDAQEFVRLGRRGLKLVREKAWFQGGNALRSAHEFWHGDFLPGITVAGETAEQLRLLYVETVMARLRALRVAGEESEALQTIETAWSHDRCNERLVEAFHSLLCESGQAARAHRLIRQYEQALREADYEETEISDALNALWI